MKKKIKQKVFFILLIFWMVVIFSFSSRDADLSTQDSNRVGFFIGEHFVAGFDDWTPEEQQAFADKVDHPVRKCAHASEYALMGILAFGAVGEYRWRQKETEGDGARSESELEAVERRPFWKRWLFAWVITILYAYSDEIHQYFVPGRACRFTDVCIDSSGALFGIVLAMLVVRVILHVNWDHSR